MATGFRVLVAISSFHSSKSMVCSSLTFGDLQTGNLPPTGKSVKSQAGEADTGFFQSGRPSGWGVQRLEPDISILGGPIEAVRDHGKSANDQHPVLAG